MPRLRRRQRNRLAPPVSIAVLSAAARRNIRSLAWLWGMVRPQAQYPAQIPCLFLQLRGGSWPAAAHFVNPVYVQEVRARELGSSLASKEGEQCRAQHGPGGHSGRLPSFFQICCRNL